jgi:GAF domain-containing protein
VNAHDGLPPSFPVGDSGAWAFARRAMSAAVADESLSGLPAALQRICRGVRSSLLLSGAVVQVITDAREAVVLASSDGASRRLGEIAFEVGEGPCLDAFTMGRPVLMRDLLGEGQFRFPGYVSAISGDGVRAAYAFPLHVGAVRVGVLELYDTRVRTLSSDELSLALIFAQAATDTLLEPPKGSSVALLEEPNVEGMAEGVGHWVEIHQAQGMVTVDLDLDLAGALSLMRAHAFSHDLSLLEVARMILAGERIHVTDGD